MMNREIIELMKANELTQDNLLATHAQHLTDHGYGHLTTSRGIDKLTGFFVPPEKEIRQDA